MAEQLQPPPEPYIRELKLLGEEVSVEEMAADSAVSEEDEIEFQKELSRINEAERRAWKESRGIIL